MEEWHLPTEDWDEDQPGPPSPGTWLCSHGLRSGTTPLAAGTPAGGTSILGCPRAPRSREVPCRTSRRQPECPPRRHCSPLEMCASPHKQFPTCPSVTSSVSAEVKETSASSWGHRRNPSLRVRSWRPSHRVRARNQQKGHVQVQAPQGASLPPSLYRRDEDSHQLPTQDGGLKSTQWHLGAASPSTPRSPLPFSLP